MKKMAVSVFVAEKKEPVFVCWIDKENKEKTFKFLLSKNLGSLSVSFSEERTFWFRLKQVREGFRWRYPLCCIIDFCFSDRPGWKYGSLPSKLGGKYVPCRMCSNK